MKKAILLVIPICWIIVVGQGSLMADTIEKGTFSLGGASTTSYTMRNFEYADNVQILNFSVQGGYFVINNLELQVAFDYYREDGDHGYEKKSHGIRPMVNYYIPLSQSVNLFGGVGFAWYETNMDTTSGSFEDNSFSYGLKAGCEVFFNPNVAAMIGFSYWRIDWDLEGYTRDSDTEDRILFPYIGIKVYF